MIIFQGDEITLHHHNGETDYLIITFESLPNGDFFLKSIVEKYNISCLGFTSNTTNYYIHPDMEKAIALCNDISKNYKKIIVIGLCLSGYAALKYSKRLNANIVFAMAPRCTIDKDICTITDQTRDSIVPKLSEQEIKKSTIQTEDLQGKIYIAYDPLSPLGSFDSEHIGFLKKQQPQITYIPTYFSGHVVILTLQGTIVFKSIIDALVSQNDQKIINTVTHIRRHHIANIINRTTLLMEKYPYFVYKMLASEAFSKVKNNDKLLSNYKLLLKLCFFLKRNGYQQESSDCLNSIALLKTGNHNSLQKINSQLPNLTPYPYIISFNGYHLAYNYKTKQLTSSADPDSNPYCLPIQLYNQNGKFKLICIHQGFIFELQYQNNFSCNLTPLSDSYTTKHIKVSFSGHMIFIHTIDKKHYLGMQIAGNIHQAKQALDWESFTAIPMTFSTPTLQQDSLSVNINNHKITISIN